MIAWITSRRFEPELIIMDMYAGLHRHQTQACQDDKCMSIDHLSVS